jgi:hypothetical protein
MIIGRRSSRGEFVPIWYAINGAGPPSVKRKA